jgi:hypothetical protein
MASKNKFEIEFPIRSSLRILYNQISSPDGLSEWFADNVNLSGKMYTFFWDGDEQEAELLSKKNNQDISLIVTDFAEDEEEEEEGRLLWDKQIEKLRQSIGS